MIQVARKQNVGRQRKTHVERDTVIIIKKLWLQDYILRFENTYTITK